MNNPYIRSLSGVSIKHLLLVGGKAASLGELINAGLPVPPAFVITTNCYKKFKNLEFPVEVKELILKAFDDLRSERVAVRSSAIGEDSKGASWAGQLETYLNISKENLIETIRKCWESIYSERALSYAAEKNVNKNDLAIGVVVQKMVNSEISGIMFTVNPVTNDKNQIMIEAGYGLGELLVQGIITPDNFLLNKKTFQILESKIETQETMLIYKNGETMQVSVPKEKKNMPALNEKQIAELVRMGLIIEKHYLTPQDIEWAFEKGKFYIVQSRPITTLSSSSQVNSQNYEKLFSRDFSLASTEAWVRGESTNPKEWTKEKQPYLPYIITERSDDTVHFYYNLQGVEWVQDLLVKIAHEDTTFLKKIETIVLEKLKFIRPIYEKGIILDSAQLKRFIKELEEGYPWFEAMWWFCQMDKSKLAGLKLENIQKVRALTDALCNGSDTVIRKSLLKLYPYLGDLSSVLHTEEILTEKIPSKEKLEERYRGYFFGNGRLFTNVTKPMLAAKLGINFIEENFEKSNLLKGEIAQKGIVRGRVKRVMGHRQIKEIKMGEILVSPMTTPDFLPAMKKAAAIVTDEGGVVCHAAIVARELKKPCIVGTKFATQLLKDGDFVEVDANIGEVRILKSKLAFKQNDYIFALWFQGVSVFVTDIHNDLYKKLEALFIIDNGMFKQYFSKKAYEKALNDGVKFYSGKHTFDNYKKNLTEFCEIFTKFFKDNIENKEILSKEVVSKLFEYAKKLCGDYTMMNFESTDKAFTLSENNPIIKKNLSEMPKFKETIRNYMNMVLFEPKGYSYQLFGILSRQFKLPVQVLESLTQKEILRLFEGVKPDTNMVSKRQLAFVESYNLGYCLEGKDAEPILQEFREEIKYAKIIKGQTASKGRVTGKVKIIPVDYSDLGRINEEIKKMQKGEILVAETTAPELMLAVKKAGAIVTDMGGLMSHAAIVSREFGIPCIVGTRNASKILKDGDLVEVDADADAGIIKIR